ncbi:MAG: nickel/cobalt transporter [Rhizobiales bacterium]|nr:nickel/cobalt transporter [Hyphomicrobiales bacterium]
MTILALILLLSLFVGPFVTLPVQAQATEGASQTEQQPKIDRRKLLVQPRNADGSVKAINFFDDPVLWMQEKQRSYYGSMQQSIKAMNSTSPLAAAFALMGLSFGYGVFHAAGPGHGKAVISAWLLATENQLRRGIAIAFMSALVQALTAIAIVSGLLLLAYLVLVANPGSTSRYLAGVLESVSYALIAGMGLYLIWTAFRPHAHGDDHNHEHDHHHHHAHDHNHHGHDHHHHEHEHHHHGHAHYESCDCGHAHVPVPGQLKGPWSWRQACSMAFAIGIRPCSGALIVLFLAYQIGLYWAGVASTLVMALGTAITVSVIAAIAVYSKHFALRWAKKDDAWMTRLGFWLRVCGGIVIAGFGGLLFWASLGTVNTMM